MIGEIKVVEGNRKRFVEYCHYFISEIDKSIKEEGADKEGTSLTVSFDTYNHPYYYEGVALIMNVIIMHGVLKRRLFIKKMMICLFNKKKYQNIWLSQIFFISLQC